MKDIHQEDEPALVPDNSSGTVFIRIAIPELKNQVCKTKFNVLLNVNSVRIEKI